MAEQRFLDLPAELRTLVEFLEDDDRPSAIFESEDKADGVYQNAALRRLELAGDCLRSLVEALEHGQVPAQGMVDGRLWKSKRVAQRWMSLVCIKNTPVQNGIVDSGVPIAKGHAVDPPIRSAETGRLLDWTRFDVPGLPPYSRFVRNYDWASTAVGAIEAWPIQLRQRVVSMIDHPHPRMIIWGAEQTFIYNEAAVPMVGQKHPGCLGKPTFVAFAELWQDMAPLVDAAYGGKVIHMSGLPLVMERSTLREETFFDFTLLPIVGPDGRVVGISDEATEITATVRRERRRACALKFSEHLNSANTMDDLWSSLLAGLESAVEDVPFAMFYAVVNDAAEDTPENACLRSTNENTKCVLKGTMGLAPHNASATQSFSLADRVGTSSGIVRPCIEAWRTRRPVVVSSEDGTLPATLTAANPDRGFGDEVNTAILMPITSLGSSETGVLGILVMGLNPRCCYDQDYSLWTLRLAELVQKAAVLISFPEEQRRARKIADEMNDALAQRLHMTTLQAERSEARFSQMAESAPTGMFTYDVSGRLLHVNDAYLEILGETREQQVSRTVDKELWAHTIHSDDLDSLLAAWETALTQKTPVTIDYRLRRPWKSVDQATGQELTGETWLSANAFPDLDSEGNVLTLQGWLTDISHRKFSDKLLSQRLEDALESKRQTENFIDMTSHEMRNPLSAILQSADSIVSNLDTIGMPIMEEDMALPHDLADEIVDAAQTIILCAKHQKRIVDDILTLSKLDASLLVISPDKIQLPHLVEKALKMYDSELVRADITTKLCVERSYTELNVDWIVVDSSRLLQIIINLLTNAIKFTQHSEVRQIKICLGASYERPTGEHHQVNFIPVRPARQVQAFGADWGSGEDMYLQVAVTDTGKGLSDDEITLLFQRFSQASPKTYKQYGGSGLGLFISRELSELQGGQIGVSNAGGKTTFTFFVKAKRWLPERNNMPVNPPRSTSSSESIGQLPHIRKESVELVATSVPAAQQPVHLEPVSRTPDMRRASVSVNVRKESVTKDVDGKLHVLIVEDNLINQKVMSQQLGKAGCIVHVANHGVECLNFLEQSFFCGASTPLSIVLLDLEMPVMDGMTCIRQIRAQQANGEILSHVPVIAVTANARSEQIAVAIEAGMDQVVTKPFRIPELVPQMKVLIDEVSQRAKT